MTIGTCIHSWVGIALLTFCSGLAQVWNLDDAWSAEPRGELTVSERAAVLRHGPWPPPATTDPSNRLSGQPAAIHFGRTLFFDPELSPDGRFSCASCHDPVRAFADGLARGEGRRLLDRNTPTVAGIGARRWYGWDGANDNLWGQSIRPIVASYEMNSTPRSVYALITAREDLRCGFIGATGEAPEDLSPEEVLVIVGKSLAAYQERLIIGRGSFDEFRDALASGDAMAMALYPAAARRGLKLFVGHGRCSVCHFGPAFTNGEFDSVGVGHFLDPRHGGSAVDKGRYGGIEYLKQSPVTLLSRFNDDPARAPGTATAHVVLRPSTFGQFKVPSLRNVARTGPYMHAGSHPTLASVLEHYNRIDPDRLHARGEQLLRPLRLSASELGDLEAFLQTLGGEIIEALPDHSSAQTCAALRP